jgi:hypothetical protein
MNRQGNGTELLVVDVASVPKRSDRLVIVEVTSGQPKGGMVFTSPGVVGRWRVTEFALYQPDLSKGFDPARIPLGLEALGPSDELQPGARLIEETVH